MKNFIRCCISLMLSIPVWADGQFSVLTYNVSGLPSVVSGGNPAVNTIKISPLLNGYDIVTVQEDFSYHADLTSSLDHSYRSSHSGDVFFGDGMNQFSYKSFSDFSRMEWNDCHGVFDSGSDCLTPKGFSFSRVVVGEGAIVDVYNLHADASTDSKSNAARASNMFQLLDFINLNSKGHAVIIAGDTNSRFTRQADKLHHYISAGFKDAWVEIARNGDYPQSGAPALVNCGDKNSASCERVDKVLYRSSTAVSLSLVDSYVPSHFVDANGKELADHDPVVAVFSFSNANGLYLTSTLGGPHGTFFNDLKPLEAAGYPELSQIRLRAGKRVDGIGFRYSNQMTLNHGGSGGGLKTLSLSPNEYINKITACQDKKSTTRIFYLKFTSNFNKSLSGGSYRGSCNTWLAPEGKKFIGAYGRSGGELDKIGFIAKSI